MLEVIRVLVPIVCVSMLVWCTVSITRHVRWMHERACRAARLRAERAVRRMGKPRLRVMR